MKAGFYIKLAWNGITKNRRLYLPYLLTCAGMVMMYYIIAALQEFTLTAQFRGWRTMESLLGMGTTVIALFGLIFLAYTNSFLIRRRKREFGLYNILGMGKRHIAFILIWDSIISCVLSIASGLLGGILLSKLAELLMLNIMQEGVTYTLTVSRNGLSRAVFVFAVIHALLFLKSLLQVRFSSALALLKSENTGEKAPRANWPFAILGVILLGVAYTMAVSIQQPLTALMAFFAAVILVILASYLLFMSGSVALCRLLQRNKAYYYKKNHFVSLSSMIYRMKRNGAGLASICILATMVLVTISSTTCLYFGMQDSITQQFVRDIHISFRIDDEQQALNGEIYSAVHDNLVSYIEENGIDCRNVLDYPCLNEFGQIRPDGLLETDYTKISGLDQMTYENVFNVTIIALEDYNIMTGADESIPEGEVMIAAVRGSYPADRFSLDGKTYWTVSEKKPDTSTVAYYPGNAVDSLLIVLPGTNTLENILKTMPLNSYEEPVVNLWHYYLFDSDIGTETLIELNGVIRSSLHDGGYEGGYSHNAESRAAFIEDSLSLYGGLFFLGIMLSLMFAAATILIIYYKQISEGYEDQSRFEIMQKVGMTKQDIRKSINSQLLTVFFLPLLGAGLHLTFAFPMLRKMILLFSVFNTGLLIATTVISFLVFALFYSLTYRVTSNAYYKIVSTSAN